ncbi:hypothetical protein SELMODRAFT_423430 [Selaginella moellendorffii]|uniref:Uncharacterized protein n=1 Tax=Selaginella moellendorffii TaxID=88036 RepID=D8SLP4_SELML|nr:hypothetical protein SELMODRAFT_423430 [Selaginella moellendorffii]
MGLISGWWEDNLSTELEEGTTHGGAQWSYRSVSGYQGIPDFQLVQGGVVKAAGDYKLPNNDMLMNAVHEPFGFFGTHEHMWFTYYSRSIDRILGSSCRIPISALMEVALEKWMEKLKSHTCGETGCSVYSVAVIDHTHACHEKMCISHGAAEMCMMHCTARYPPEVSGRRDMVQTSKVVLRKMIITVAAQVFKASAKRSQSSISIETFAEQDSREKYSSERRQRHVASSCDWNQALIGRTSRMCRSRPCTSMSSFAFQPPRLDFNGDLHHRLDSQRNVASSGGMRA